MEMYSLLPTVTSPGAAILLALVIFAIYAFSARKTKQKSEEEKRGVAVDLRALVDRVFMIIWSAPERDLYLVCERNRPDSERLLSTRSVVAMKVMKGGRFIVFTTRGSGEVVGSIFCESQEGYAYIDAKKSYMSSALAELNRRVGRPDHISKRREESEDVYESLHRKLFV